MRANEQLLVIAVSFILGVLLYIFAGLSAFGVETVTLVIVALTFIGGLGTLVLGYGSVIIIGGTLSLRIAEFIARFTRSKHIIEVSNEEPQTRGHRILQQAFIIYMSALIFTLSATLSWDIHNLHDPQTSIFHPLLHELDVFSKLLSTDSITSSVDVILTMIVLTAIAGIAPSMAIPYFRRFKITGVNSGPFHTNLLLTVAGLIAGISALLTLIGHLYQVLWVGKGTYYYHYMIPAMIGFSLHYTIGVSLGRDKSEEMVKTMLEATSSERIIRGTLSIQGAPADNAGKTS